MTCVECHSASRLAGHNRLSRRLRLCCLHLFRRPCRAFSVWAHFVSDPPSPSRHYWQASSRCGLWLEPIESYSTSRPTTSPHRANSALASERLAFARFSRALHRLRSVPIQHTTDGSYLLRHCLVLSLQRHLGMLVHQPFSPRFHHRPKSSSSSLSSGIRAPIGRVNNAPNRFVTSPLNILSSDVPRSSPTISSFAWRLTNAAHCRKCTL